MICGSQSPLVFVITPPKAHYSHRSLGMLETSLPFWQLSNPRLHEKCKKSMQSSFWTLSTVSDWPSGLIHPWAFIWALFITDTLAPAFLQLLKWVQNEKTWQRRSVIILHIQAFQWPACPYTAACSPLQRIHLHRELRASSFREVVLVSFHRLSTFPGEAPTHNDPTLTFSCVSVLKRWRAEILALYKGIFACSESALLRTTVLLPRSRLWQGEELYFQDTRAELLVSLTTTEQFSAPNYAFTVVHLFFIITKE